MSKLQISIHYLATKFAIKDPLDKNNFVIQALVQKKFADFVFTEGKLE